MLLKCPGESFHAYAPFRWLVCSFNRRGRAPESCDARPLLLHGFRHAATSARCSSLHPEVMKRRAARALQPLVVRKLIGAKRAARALVVVASVCVRLRIRNRERIIHLICPRFRGFRVI